MKDVLEEICQREFNSNPSSEIEKVEEGLMSHTFKVEIDEDAFVVQIAENTAPHELENCVNCFKFVQASKVRVPEVFSGLKEVSGNYYTIVEFVEGDTLGEDFTEKETFEAGKMLAKIHESESFENAGWWSWENGRPQVEGFSGNSLMSRIEELMAERLEFFKDRGLQELDEITERFLEDHLEKIPEDFEPVFVHHDFNPGNILSKDGELTAILDFDYAHAGHAQRDLAKASNKFWLRNGKRENLYKGYREVREIDESFNDNEALFQLESLLDEIAAMLEHDHITEEEALSYVGELERIESEI